MSALYATDYTPEQLARTRQTLLQVLVGVLVPSLLIDQAEAAARNDTHVGSIDIDLGVRLAVVDEDRYDELAERLRDRGFEPDTNERGNLTKQRWRYARAEDSVVVDFLIDETETEGPTGAARSTSSRTSPRTSPPSARSVSGTTLDGDAADRPVRVCGPAAFVVLKAIAFRNRGSEKDAYDLVYVARNWPGGPEAVAERWAALGNHPALTAALDVLRADFLLERALGPRSASRFLTGAYVADAVGDLTLFVETASPSAGQAG